MNMRGFRAVALGSLGILSALAACAPPGGGSRAPAPPPERRTVTGVGGSQGNVDITVEQGVIVTDLLATADAAWEALMPVYQSLEIEIGKIDPDRRAIGHPAISVSRRMAGLRLSRLFRCGDTMTGPIADESRVTVTIETRIEAMEDGSRVLSMISASAIPFDGSGANRECTTTGKLETEIHQALVARLAG